MICLALIVQWSGPVAIWFMHHAAFFHPKVKIASPSFSHQKKDKTGRLKRAEDGVRQKMDLTASMALVCDVVHDFPLFAVDFVIFLSFTIHNTHEPRIALS